MNNVLYWFIIVIFIVQAKYLREREREREREMFLLYFDVIKIVIYFGVNFIQLIIWKYFNYSL